MLKSYSKALPNEPIELNVGFVSDFDLTKIGNISNIGGNIDRNVVNLWKSIEMVKKNLNFDLIL